MRYPQIVILAFDEWLGKQLRELAAEARWRLREVRQPAAALALLRDPRPTVLLVQADPHDEKAAAFALLADAHRTRPDAAAVVVCDVKLSEADRVAWAAASLDLGARYVLFPPLARPVLEDVVSGLMAAVIRRTLPADAPAKPAEAPVIDLAHEGQADA
jgi:hypothetical protein